MQGIGHPEIIERSDTFLLTLCDALCDIRDAMFPERDPMPRYTALSQRYLTDVFVSTLAVSEK